MRTCAQETKRFFSMFVELSELSEKPLVLWTEGNVNETVTDALTKGRVYSTLHACF